MSLEDKYPPETGRRRFVKGMVGSGTACSVGAGGAFATDITTNPSGVDSGQTQFVGIANTAGPAPRGMPLVPLELEDGYLKGRYPPAVEREENDQTYTTAEEERGGLTYSVRWFQYCGVEAAEGLRPEADQDNYLVNGGGYPWQQELDSDERLHLDHLADYEEWDNGVGTPGLGKPAKANWRSQGEDVTDIPVMLLRTPELPAMIDGEGTYSRLPDQVRTFLDAATVEDCMAWLDKCTHFCCVPQFKATGSAKFDGEDAVYCACHQSVYDPFLPRLLTFTARPRPEE